ncbi:MAG: polysaccharide pyruvyl transferase family protein [Pyrinomonadaceae bacterium]
MTGSAKTVLLAGAPTLCWPNAGDEAILAAMVEDLRRVAPDVEITVASCNPVETLECYRVKGVPFSDITQLIDAARSTDLMILGGGSIFYDYWGFDPGAILTGNHQGLAFYSGFALLASLLNRPLMIYAVGVGPLQSEMGRRFTRLAFEQAHVITVRDHESKSLLETLGLDASRVRVTADPAFNLQTGDKRRSIETERPLIGVALRNWDIGVDPDEWEREVAAALDAFIESHGGTPLFIPFHKAVNSSLTDDLGIAERVSGLMRHGDKAILFREDCPPGEKAELIEGCDLVLGMRLHSVIFAIKGKVPTVALTYDPKVTSVMRSVDCQQYGIELDQLTAQKLTSLLAEAYARRSELRALLSDRVEPLTILSRENARLAADLLMSDAQPRQELTPLTVDVLKSLEISHALRAYELESQASLLPARHLSPRDLAQALDLSKQLAVRQDNMKASGPRSQNTGQRRIACLTNRLLDWDTQEPCFGGGERYCLTLGSLLRDLGFDVTFYQSAHHSFTGDYYGFKTVALPHGESFSEFQYGVCDAFYELSAAYDHVIYNLANYASGRVRDDAILICHGIWFDYDSPSFFAFRTPEWFEHLYKAFSRAGKVVSVDANSINVIRSLWPEVASRMTYLPNWVDTKLFHPPERRNSGPVTIIFPRRSNHLRGAHLLGPILERIPHDCRVWWIGEGEAEDNEQIEALARRDPRLKFYAASFDEMPELYRGADICVIPTVASEGTSLSCLEALASGCAVIATTVGGLPELIQPGVNGLLVDPQAEQLAAAINRLIEQHVERSRLQEAASQMAASFSLDVWQQRWRAQLEQMNWLPFQAQTSVSAAKQTVETTGAQPLAADSVALTLLKDVATNLSPGNQETSSQAESVRLLEKRILRLTASLAERERAARALSATLSEREQAAQALSTELQAREKIIRARDEGIAWLQTELKEREQAMQALAKQLTIHSSRGRRLLSRYGAIKHRYLSPIYRMLRLPSTGSERRKKNQGDV